MEVESRTLDMGVRATPSNLTMAIDLTKYEGHTEGPWESEEWDEGKILGPILERHRNNHPIVAVVGYGWWGDMMPERNANLRLMTDAPLLKEEVKRLEKLLNHISDLFEEGLCYSDEWWATEDCDEQEKLPFGGVKIADSGVHDWPNVHFCSKKMQELRRLLS